MMKSTLETSEDKVTKQRRQSADPETDRQAVSAQGEQQSELSQRIAAGPAMTAQRKIVDGMTAQSEPVQKLSPEEDEEMMQGKFAAQFQGPEEEEMLQGSFETSGPRTATSDTKR